MSAFFNVASFTFSGCAFEANLHFFQVFVVDEKMFTLDTIDNLIKGLNLRSFDGDKPSLLNGINLTTIDSNLHQHGIHTV